MTGFSQSRMDGDEALPAVPDHARRLADHVLRRVIGLGPWGQPAAPEVGSGAEGLVARRSDDHARTNRSDEASRTQAAIWSRMNWVIAFPGIGPVEGDPADPVLNPAQQVIARRALGRVAHRSPWCVVGTSGQHGRGITVNQWTVAMALVVNGRG